ncbi:MAG: transketolase C-terminal domain-containing protein [Candidatus Bathyarchaeia archaeon]
MAEGVRLSEVNVVAAYPISPQTTIIEYIVEYIANGQLKAQFIQTESEFSAMAACIGASAVGARTFTATCSQGLALMHELNYVAAGLRLPIVMAVTNRRLSQPLGMWCDHSDAMGERDSGWLQIYVESCQEALDTIIQAYKIAENKEVLMPVMVCLDGFILSHTCEVVVVPEFQVVREFLPPYEPDPKHHTLLSLDAPMAAGGGCPPAYAMEFDYKKFEAHEKAKEVIRKVDDEFANIFGRRYGLVEAYRCEDAEIILISMGTIVSTAKEVVDRLRDKGWLVGVLKIRSYRPFPKEDILKFTSNAKVVAVVNRAISYGVGAPLFSDVAATLYNASHKPLLLNFIAGIGGRDVTPKDITAIFESARKAVEKSRIEKEIEWVGLNKAIVGG